MSSKYYWREEVKIILLKPLEERKENLLRNVGVG